jgi:hypothetical protein
MSDYAWRAREDWTYLVSGLLARVVIANEEARLIVACLDSIAGGTSALNNGSR